MTPPWWPAPRSTPTNAQSATAPPPIHPPSARTCSHLLRSSGPKYPDGTVGVSDDPPGETYWKVKNGIRLSGMPAYGKALTDQQLWQVSLLLSVANKPIPAEATQALAQ